MGILSCVYHLVLVSSLGIALVIWNYLLEVISCCGNISLGFDLVIVERGIFLKGFDLGLECDLVLLLEETLVRVACWRRPCLEF